MGPLTAPVYTRPPARHKHFPTREGATLRHTKAQRRQENAGEKRATLQKFVLRLDPNREVQGRSQSVRRDAPALRDGDQFGE